MRSDIAEASQSRKLKKGRESKSSSGEEDRQNKGTGEFFSTFWLKKNNEAITGKEPLPPVLYRVQVGGQGVWMLEDFVMQ